MSFHFGAILGHFIQYPKRLTRQNLITLFVISVFPFHTWAIYQVFNDVEWILRRSNIADFVAFGSYSMVFALFESLVIALIVWPLGLLTLERIKSPRLINLLGTIIWILAFWAIISNLLALPELDLGTSFSMYLFSLKHPLRTAYIIAAGFFTFLVSSVAAPLYILWKYPKTHKGATNFFDRISILSWIYLVLDAAGFLFIIFRNLSL